MHSVRSLLPMLVMTFIYSVNMPLLLVRFTLALISALEPAGIDQGADGNSAVVQPQVGSTYNIVTLLELILVKLKVKWAKLSPSMTTAV